MLGVAGAPAAGAGTGNAGTGGRGEELASLLAAEVGNGLPGAHAQVREAGRVYRLAAGVADVTTGRPARPGAYHRVGGVTRSFVAVAVLQLAGERRIDLDRPIGRYLPDVVPDERGRQITVRMLLNHTSGIADYGRVSLAADGEAVPAGVLFGSMAEGLLSYVSARVESELFEGVRQLSAPGSRLALDAIAGNLRDRVVGSPASADWERYVGVRADTVWNTELRTEPVDVMRAGGWKVDVARLADAAQRYGRPVPGVMSAAADVTMLLTATN